MATRSSSFEGADDTTAVSRSYSRSSLDGKGKQVELELRQGPFLASTDRACDPCRQRKIRCDRVLPNCVNCQRGNLACAYSDRTRRGKTVKKLAEDLEDFEARVKSLESKDAPAETVRGLQGRLERIEGSLDHALSTLDSLHLRTEEVSKAVNNVAPVSGYLNDTHNSAIPANTCYPAKDIGYVDKGGDDTEKYYGSSSMLTLMREAACGLDSATQEQVDEVRQELLSSSKGKFSGFLGIADITLYQAGLPAILPSEALVNALLQPFFEDVNSVYPVFDQSGLLDQIKSIYASPTGYEKDFNCLTLNCLVSHTLSSRCKSKVQGSSDRMADAELLRPFIESITRSFSALGELQKPSLLNAQALVSLCLFAQDNFPIEVAEQILEQACSCATSMGLHRRGQHTTNDNSLAERQNLFWSLFIIDKNLSLLTGKSARLPWYDCEVQLPEPSQSDLPQSYFVSRARLSIIQEQVYSSLYSADALRQTELVREQAIVRLSDKLQQWLHDHARLLSKKEFLGDKEPMQHLGLELSILCGMHLIMVCRQARTAASLNKCYQTSREVMEKLYQLAQRTELRGKEASLRRIFTSTPFAAFPEIFSKVFRSEHLDTTLQENVQHLSHSFEVLEFITRFDAPHNYCSKLCIVTSHYSQLARTRLENTSEAKQHKKRRFDHDSSSDSLKTWDLTVPFFDETPLPSMSVSDETAASSSGGSEILVDPTAGMDMMRYFETEINDTVWDRDWVTRWSARGN